MDDANDEALRREPPDFAAALESLHERFLGEKAHTREWIERRRSASAAYDQLTSAEGSDTHHHLEVLAGTLDVDLPAAP